MFLEAFPLAFLIELGVVGQTELNGAADDHLGVDIAVGFGDDLPVDAAGRPAGGSPMIFYGLAHDLHLVGREPFLQTGIGSEDLTPADMMVGPMTNHPQIVIGSNGVDHVDIGSGGSDELEGTTDDTGDVLEVVSTVESCITRENLGLDEFHQIKARAVVNHKLLRIFLQIYEKLITFARK